MLQHPLKLLSYTKLFHQLVDLDKRNRLPSRILFSGQEGIGKTAFSLHLINYLFSKNEKNNYNLLDNTINPENLSYRLVKNISHPNFYLISKAVLKKNIDIDQIRSMMSFLNKSSFDNSKKIILIDSAENLNASSSNALLKCLEESNEQNLFLLTHSINKKIIDTIKSRCIIFNLNFNYSEIQNTLIQYFNEDLYPQLNEDFKAIILSPKFLINHIIFIKEHNLDLNSTNIENIIRFVVENKSFKKNIFITNHFQTYIEIYFSKMYSLTKDRKYYDDYLTNIKESSAINKFNLDLDSFFIKFENQYL